MDDDLKAADLHPAPNYDGLHRAVFRRRVGSTLVQIRAIRMAGRLLRAAGMCWRDITDGHRRAEVATEAAAVLLAENAQLGAELDQLRGAGTAVAIWADVGAQVSDVRIAAQWALGLNRRGDVWLSNFEIPFLERCTRWTGRLTPKMQPVFQRIMDRLAERGLTPP